MRQSVSQLCKCHIVSDMLSNCHQMNRLISQHKTKAMLGLPGRAESEAPMSLAMMRLNM